MRLINRVVARFDSRSGCRHLISRRTLLTRVLLCSVLSCLTPANAANRRQPASWPHFHGPGRDNISTETDLLKKWPAEGPKLVWKFSGCGRGYSGVSTADGMIFTAGDFGPAEKVIALDMAGQLLWESPNGKSWTGPHPGSRTTPAYNDGVVYQMNPTGRLAAWRARSGKELWAVDLQERFGAKYGIWAMAENVIVKGDHVYCVPGGSKALVAALDKKTGKTVWTSTQLAETAAYCSPALARYKGIDMLITLTQKSVIGVDIKTGKLLWSHPHITKHDQNITTPVFDDGYVFVASGHFGGGRCVKINDRVDGVKEIWWNKDLDNCHGGVIYQGGYIYGSACRQGGKGFFCVNLRTGNVKYLDKKLEKLSFTCADGMLYGISQKGMMFLIAHSPEQFEIAGSFQLPRDGRMPAFAHPVICDGKLYLRQNRNLSAYNIRNPKR